MARTKAPVVDALSVPLTTGADSTIPRIKFSENGQPGMNIIGGTILDGCAKELQWPWCINTYNNMRRDATVSSAIQLVETMISKVKWKIEIPHDATDDMKRKKKFLEECIADLDTSLYQTIKEISSFNTYGFSVMEKVFRKRLKSNGSYYDDGLIGIKKIVPRGQETIAKWEMDEYNREIQGVRQWTTTKTGDVQQMEIYPGVLIPREKFMLFRTNVRKNSPIGVSPLNYCWESWKFKKALEEAEAIGVSKDMRGLPVLTIPVQYMVDGASDSDKQTYEYLKKVMRNLHREEQEGLIIPSIFDDAGNKMFNFELAGVTGTKSFNVGDIIDRYSNEILMSFFADVLKLGQGATGSYSLADSKTSIIATRIEAALMEIQDQLNNDLVRQLAQLNGWNPVDMPKFAYGDIDNQDIGEYASALQRVKATGLVVPSPKNINYIAEALGLPDRVDESMSQEDLNELLGPSESASGSGLKEGLPSGTGNNNGSSGDSSVSNKEN